MSIKTKYFDTSSVQGVLFLNMLRCDAIRILDVLGEMLEDKGIAIPDEERTSDESVACLYGMTYADLEKRNRRIAWQILSFAGETINSVGMQSTLFIISIIHY